MEVSILIACEKIRREKYATKKETSICNRGICRCECSCLCDSGNPWKYRKFGVYGKTGTKGNGGEIFVFDMGKPVRIADLAQRMINLSGAKNVEIKYTGLRAGEKLYEEVLNDKESTKPSFNNKIRIAKVREYDYSEVCRKIDSLIETSKLYDDMATVKKMKEIVPEFKSNNSIYEVLDTAKA